MKTYERFSAALDELFLRLKTQRLWYKLPFERSEEEMRNPETGIKTAVSTAMDPLFPVPGSWFPSLCDTLWKPV